jgi:hypothetical protein
MKERIVNERGKEKKLKGTTTPLEQVVGIIVEGAEIFSNTPSSEVDLSVETDLPLTIIHLNHSFIMQIYHSICMELICTLHPHHHHHQALSSKLNSKAYFSLHPHHHHLHSTIPISISTHITHLKASTSTVRIG